MRKMNDLQRSIDNDNYENGRRRDQGCSSTLLVKSTFEGR